MKSLAHRLAFLCAAFCVALAAHAQEPQLDQLVAPIALYPDALVAQVLVPDGSAGSGMARWRSQLFAAMTRNSGRAAEHFMLPVNRVVELGAKMAL